MNKLKKVFAVAAGCLMSACSVLGSGGVSAESEFNDLEHYVTINKSILSHSHPKKLIKVPRFRQTTWYTCGIACMLSILRYSRYDFDISESDLTTALDANEYDGTKAGKMVDYLNAVRYNGGQEPCFEAELRQNMTIDDLKREIDQNHPVICAIEAWNWDENGEYTMDLDYSEDWESGHWAIAIGYNKDNIFFMDPSTPGYYTYIPKNRLDQRWHDYEWDENWEPNLYLTHAGIVVKLLGNRTPDADHYRNAFYGTM